MRGAGRACQLLYPPFGALENLQGADEHSVCTSVGCLGLSRR